MKSIEIDTKEIISRLAKLQADVDFIKENFIEEDDVLTEDDLEALRLAEEEYKRGETISHEELKKELGI